MRGSVSVLHDRDLLQFNLLGAPPRAVLLERVTAWLASPVPQTEELTEDDLEAAEILKDMAWRTKAGASNSAT